jgi:hypothetical protein
MRKAYLLVFSEATGGKEKIREWLNTEDLVLHWRTDLPSTFYVISEASAADLSQSLSTHIERKGRFLFAEVGENRQGLLPKESWYLLRNKRRQPPNEA